MRYAHAMANRTIRTDKKRSAFLAAVTRGCTVSAACKAAGISRSIVYEWREANPPFAAEWDSASEASVDVLEATARKRALKNSDLLLIFLLKHRRPDVFRPSRSLQLGGLPDGQPIKTETTGKVTIFLPDNTRGDRADLERNASRPPLGEP